MEINEFKTLIENIRNSEEVDTSLCTQAIETYSNILNQLSEVQENLDISKEEITKLKCANNDLYLKVNQIENTPYQEENNLASISNLTFENLTL